MYAVLTAWNVKDGWTSCPHVNPPAPAFAVLEIQLTASGVLDKCSPMKPHPQPFLVTFFVCMDAGCMPVCRGEAAHMYRYEDWTLILGAFLNYFPPYFLHQGLSLNTELSFSLVWLAGMLQRAVCFCLPVLRL